MLMDVNIFWRTIKLAYCSAHVSHNIRGALDQVCPVLGVWHAYAHCVKKVYDAFLPWWACIEVHGFLHAPENSVVYTKPKLITMEHLVMGVFLASAQVEQDIRRTLGEVHVRFGVDSPQAQQCDGLLLLVTEYVPALVNMGIAVRHCYWTRQMANTGNVARKVYRDAIVLLSGLCGRIPTEYIRNIMLSDLMWSDLHAALPAAAFVEECLESSLSTLARRKATDARATTVGDFSDLYDRIPANMWFHLLKPSFVSLT